MSSNNLTIEEQLASINSKLDVVNSELEMQKRNRLMLQDLKSELTLVGKEAYIKTAHELDSVSEQIDMEKIAYLMKTLARNSDNFIMMVENMEKFSDLMQEATPIMHSVFRDSVDTLEDITQKGYFDLLITIREISDKTMASFTKEELEQLRDNSDQLAKVLKGLANPKLHTMMGTTLETYQSFDSTPPQSVSFWGLLKMMTSQNVRRFIHLSISFLNQCLTKSDQGREQLEQ
ncbi:MAG: hypothetical protein HN353_01360 [Bdellovibrionales bacterium]|jgi:uncharacterized protein YjgD (DUF1641 family)|nr:hypothetical protein [Bdellovibrionales bacterium]MBT3525472.1 hypothetical protein [Bdellovibrionales bacterium]MBT7669960.1 hypothetical protein [Bdellovibrionales bacterium]MBT7768095.1 hypothetical protein [Bdellovibrionales bacterium]